MKITWNRVTSYEEAKDFFDVIYLHEWDGNPFYWGIVDRAKFGGRKRNSHDRNPRYGESYAHWIEGCLQHGGRLYFGLVEDRGEYSLEQIEAFLMSRYPPKMNKRKRSVLTLREISHYRDVPQSILNGGKSAEQKPPV